MLAVVQRLYRSLKKRPILTNFDLAIACRDCDVFYINCRQVDTCSAKSADTGNRLAYCYDKNDCIFDRPTSVLIVLT
jgi:hypothetical protein